jgi:hypothetical protein
VVEALGLARTSSEGDSGGDCPIRTAIDARRPGGRNEAVELPAADVREVLDRDGWRDWAAAADGPSAWPPGSTSPC